MTPGAARPTQPAPDPAPVPATRRGRTPGRRPGMVRRRPSRTDLPARSASTIAWGTFLILASATLVIVLAAGSRAPLWMVGAWLLLALALSLVVGALIPGGPRESRGPAPEVASATDRDPSAPDYTRPNGIDPAITGEPREEQEPPGRDAPGAPQ